MPPSSIKSIHKNKKIDVVLLAIQNLNIIEKRIIDNLNRLNIRVLQIPAVNDLSKVDQIDDLRSIEIEDLLEGKKLLLRKIY